MTDKVVDVDLMDVIVNGSKATVIYSQIYENGRRKLFKKNIKYLGGYYDCLNPKPIRNATCVGKVYWGLLRTKVQVLFAIKLTDDSAQLIQVSEGSREYMKLLQLCDADIIE